MIQRVKLRYDCGNDASKMAGNPWQAMDILEALQQAEHPPNMLNAFRLQSTKISD
jgi:hypothetical protein